jgi:regulator of protease activity HflC (stomatin/prohibitin superfamily)
MISKETNLSNQAKTVIVGTLGIAAVILAFLFWVIFITLINPGHVGVVVSKVGTNRGVQNVTLRTGWVVYNPALTSIIEYPTTMQTAQWTKSANEGSNGDESITFTTKDSSAVNADISVSYQLQYEKIPQFYVKFRYDDINNFTYGFLRNIVRDAFNEAAGSYSVEQVMGDNAQLLKNVRDVAQAQLSSYGIEIQQLGFINAPRPPAGVIDAINLKVQAQQIALQKQIEITQSEAEAKKHVAIAQGDAQANIVRAQADAQANKLRTESLTPALVEWTAIQKWDGHRPTVEGINSGGIMVNLQGTGGR